MVVVEELVVTVVLVVVEGDVAVVEGDVGVVFLVEVVKGVVVEPSDEQHTLSPKSWQSTPTTAEYIHDPP